MAAIQKNGTTQKTWSTSRQHMSSTFAMWRLVLSISVAPGSCLGLMSLIQSSAHILSPFRTFFFFFFSILGVLRSGNRSIRSASRFCAICQYKWADILTTTRLFNRTHNFPGTIKHISTFQPLGFVLRSLRHIFFPGRPVGPGNVL